MNRDLKTETIPVFKTDKTNVSSVPVPTPKTSLFSGIMEWQRRQTCNPKTETSLDNWYTAHGSFFRGDLGACDYV
jgi:hypothetical protein